MRIVILLLSACFFLVGCDTSTQPPKPSPLHYARVVSNQCALGCCRCRHRSVARAVPTRKHQPHSR
jgi:hypothetical protein